MIIVLCDLLNIFLGGKRQWLHPTPHQLARITLAVVSCKAVMSCCSPLTHSADREAPSAEVTVPATYTLPPRTSIELGTATQPASVFSTVRCQAA